MRAALHAPFFALFFALLFALALTAAKAQTQVQDRIKGELAVATDAGFLRLIFRMDEEVPAKVRLSGGIMVISFSKPVSVAVDRINASAPDYVSASRLDPDGTAIRIALARTVKINSIPAAERLYVDIMPDSWKGVLPGLPQEVVDDLSRRTREAERQLRSQRLAAKQKQMPTIRVKVATQPTFMRYIFEVPDQVSAVPERGDGKLTINFDQQIKWDLADAKATMPATLESIEAETDFGSAAVTFTLNGTPELRTFREDGSIMVDVGTGAAKPKAQLKEGAASVAATAPETVPAAQAPEAAPIKDAPIKDAPIKDASAAERVAKPAHRRRRRRWSMRRRRPRPFRTRRRPSRPKHQPSPRPPSLSLKKHRRPQYRPLPRRLRPFGRRRRCRSFLRCRGPRPIRMRPWSRS